MIERRPRLRVAAAWSALILAMMVPVALAAFSPWLAYRGPAYIIGGFAGIVGLALLLAQPLLAAGLLPGARPAVERRWHRWLGWAILTAIAIHVGGLWITSPPDTVDALLFVAPTTFSIYGVTAMWAGIVTAVLVTARRRMGLRYGTWRLVHNAVALVVVIGTVVHAVQIQGAMEPVSKWALCAAVLAAALITVLGLRVVAPLVRRARG